MGEGQFDAPTSNGEGFRGIQHSKSMVLDTRFHIRFIMILYYKMRQILLQNATAILLQNAIKVYYKMRQVFYYKMRQFYYKMRQLLQNATFITNCDSTLINFILSIETLPSPGKKAQNLNVLSFY